MSNVVQPRWKRRADEIADAIGDELSVTVLAPVEVGNDVRIHSDSISSFANSIAAALPTAQEIAAAMWTYSSRSVDTDGLKSSDLNLDVTGKLRVVGEGHISVDVTHVDGNTISGGAAVPVETTGNKTVAITGQVSTNIGNVTVPISNPNNITVPVTNPNNLTVPVHVGTATVPVKASTSGIAQNQHGNTVVAPVANSNNVTVPVTAAGVSVPLTNPNNLTVPVANSNNVTVPVTAGAVSVPVHVPSGTTVPASVSNTLSVPVHVGSAVVPVQNTANVAVPVANSNNVTVAVATVPGTTQAADGSGAAVTVPANWTGTGALDVNITGMSTNGQTVMKNAVENALNDATGVDVQVNNTTTDPVPIQETDIHGTEQSALEGHITWFQAVTPIVVTDALGNQYTTGYSGGMHVKLHNGGNVGPVQIFADNAWWSANNMALNTQSTTKYSSAAKLEGMQVRSWHGTYPDSHYAVVATETK